jgi:hypothetical protein
MPILRLSAKEKDGVTTEYDVELTQEQWDRYMVARREGRLHVTTDEKKGFYVIAEQVEKGKFDTSQLKEGAEIVDQGKVIAMGKMEPAKGVVDNTDGKRK